MVLFASATVADDNIATPNLYRLGQSLYQENCSICHGSTGEGDGAIANHFQPRPRNFVNGAFRFSSTPQGQPPARVDLLRIIEMGIETPAGPTMPSFGYLKHGERLALAEVIRTFAAIDEYGTPLQVPQPKNADIERGRILYSENGCIDCHGASGEGDGVLAESLSEENGAPMRPANLRIGKFKAGSQPARVWKTIQLGIAGTPMPSFGHLSAEDTWALVAFVRNFQE